LKLVTGPLHNAVLKQALKTYWEVYGGIKSKRT